MTRLSDNGRYILGAPLGAGGQGEVFEARQLDLDRRVAIKQLGHSGQIRHEARLLASLRHPNIVAVYELIEVEGRTALVMELVAGPSLLRLVSQAELASREALRMWLAIVDGLAHAHQCGVVHGDLSPSNVIIEVQGSRATPKICDFGVGRSESNPVGPRGMTHGFVAPEVRDGEEPTLRSDVYSVAMLGRFLFGNDCADPIDTLLSLATSPEPKARPADATELAERLERAGAVASSPTADLPPSEPSPPYRRGPGVAILVLLLAGSAVWWLASVPKSDHPVVDLQLALSAAETWKSQPAHAAALWHAAGVPPPAEARAVGADSLVLPHDEVVVGLASLGRNLLTADVKGVVREWELSTGTLRRQVSTGVENPVGFAAAGDRFTLHPHVSWGTSASGCAAWSMDTGDCLATLPGLKQACIHLDPRGELLWYCTRDRQQGVVLLETGETLWSRPYPAPSGYATWAERPDEIGIWTRGRIERVSLRTGEQRVIAEDLPDAGTDFVWNASGFYLTEADALYHIHPDGQRSQKDSFGDLLFGTGLGVVHGGGRVRVGTLHADDHTVPLRHTGWFAPVAWGGPRLLATADSSGRIDLINTSSGRRHRSLLGHDGNIMALATVGEWLISSGMDRTVRMWRPHDEDVGWIRKVSSGLQDAELATGQGVTLMGTRPDGRWAVWTPGSGQQSDLGSPDVVDLDREAGIATTLDRAGRWLTVDPNRNQHVERSIADGPVRCIRLHAALDRVVITRSDAFEIYRHSDGSQIRRSPLVDRAVACTILDEAGTIWTGRVQSPQLLSADGEHAMTLPFEGNIASIETPGDALIVRGYTGELAMRRGDALELVARGTTAHALEGHRLAWATRDGAVHVGGPEPWSSEPGPRVHSMLWAAGGALLLAGRSDGVLNAYTRTGRPVGAIQAHPTRIRALAVEEATGHVVSVDEDGDVQWWDTGRLTAEHPTLVTNARACQHTQRVVSVVPFPSEEVRWAPSDACEAP